jgi:ABC-2 type transport system permease protein
MWRRIGSLVIKEFIQLARDYWFTIFIIVGPATELFLVGWATGAPVDNLPLAVVDYDRTPESRALAQAFENTETFRLAYPMAQPEDVTDLLDRGTVTTVLVVPPNFAADLASDTNRPQVQVLLNGAESEAARTALGTAEGVVASYGADLTLGKLGISSGELAALAPSVRVWFNEDLSEANYTLPSELGFMLYMVALMVAALGISRERELGTLEQLLVMPLTRLELMVGKAVPAVMIAYFNFMLMLAGTVFIFGVPMRGSLALLLVLAFIYILAELGRGLLISVLSRTQLQALLIVFMIAMVDMVFSGYAVPVESMPRLFQIAANVFPIHHWMIIMRGIMLKGAGLAVFWPHLLAILVLGTLITLATLVAFRAALD